MLKKSPMVLVVLLAGVFVMDLQAQDDHTHYTAPAHSHWEYAASSHTHSGGLESYAKESHDHYYENKKLQEQINELQLELQSLQTTLYLLQRRISNLED